MKELKTTIRIQAPASKVWQHLMDFETYNSWNPFITSIEGSPEKGSKLQITIQPTGKKPTTFSPEVLVAEEKKEFRWLGHLFIPGLFDGEHYFQLRSISENETEFVHGEKFSGVMSGLIMKMIGKETHDGFESMNKSIKERSETKTTS